MGDIYEYRTPNRPVVSLVIATAVILMFGLALKSGAPWWIWAIWGPSGAAILYLIATNRQYGMRIAGDLLIVGLNAQKRTYSIANIEALVITEWDNSTDYELTMKDGRIEQLQSFNLPPPNEITEEFRLRGIPTEVK